MDLTIHSSRGHFNLVNPQEESISTWICVNGVENRRYSITTDEMYNDVGPRDAVDVAVQILERDCNRWWIDTGREYKLALKQFLIDNQDEITNGTVAKKVAILKEQRDGLDAQIRWLESYLRSAYSAQEDI